MEKILGWIEKLATGSKSRIFWAIVLVSIFVVILAYPYVDANFLCYDRIEKRLNNLEKLASISEQTIYENENLKAEYNSILDEIENSRAKKFSLINSKNESKFDYWIKVIGAGFLWFVVAIILLFSKDKKNRISLKVIITRNIWLFIFCLFVGLFLGYLLARIPVIITPWINAIVYIIGEIMIIYLLINPKKESKVEAVR